MLKEKQSKMEHSYPIFVLCIALLFQTVRGVPYINLPNEALLFEKKLEGSLVSTDVLGLASENSDLYYNSSEVLISSEMSPSENFSQSDQINSILSVSDEFRTAENSTNGEIFSSTHKVATLTEIFDNESQSSSPVDSSSRKSTTVGTGETTSTHSVASSTQGVNGSAPVTEKETDDDDDEPEGVARGKPSGTESVNVTASETESIYQKTLALISDTYTLSILVPIAAGIIFASTILIMITTCRCIQRQCRRRRLRRKVLPDSVKNLRPSDRARLLAESSDEEF